MDQTTIKRYLGVIRRACDLIEQQLDVDVSTTFEQIIKETEPSQTTQQKTDINDAIKFATPEVDQVHLSARKKHVADLMAIDCWPSAVPPHAVGPTSDSDQINRARAVLDMSIGQSIEGATFLDYGCGEGYITAEADSRGCAKVVGYDIKRYENWSKFPNIEFVTSGSDLKKSSYDLVFLYDVLDHSQDPENIMSHIQYVTAPGGTIFIRCHPWTSKHAAHLTKVGLNKSHIHLFLSWDELVNLGYEPMFTRHEKKPLEAYKWWFKDFKIVKEEIRSSPLNDFFKVDAFKDLLKNEQEIQHENMDEFMKMMAIDFVDFVLKKS